MATLAAAVALGAWLVVQPAHTVGASPSTRAHGGSRSAAVHGGGHPTTTTAVPPSTSTPPSGTTPPSTAAPSKPRALVASAPTPTAVAGAPGSNGGAAAGTPYVSDAFNRILANGWGAANIGGAYLLEKGNAADLSVDGRGGVFSIRDGAYTSAEQVLALPATNALAFAASFDVSYLENVKALGPRYGGVLAGVVARYHNANDQGNGYYRLQLVWNANFGRPSLFLRSQDDSGRNPPGHFKVEQDLGIDPTVDFPGGPPYRYHVKVQISGTNPTTVALKAWRFGAPEPPTWQLTGADTGNFGPQTTGPIGVRASADLQSAPNVYLAVTSHVSVQSLVVTPLG